MFQELDYDVVSGSGLVGAAESLQRMSVHERVPFLKVRTRWKDVRVDMAITCSTFLSIPPYHLEDYSTSVGRPCGRQC